MKNHAVAEHAPPFPGEQGHEIFFDPQGGGRGGQTEPCRQPRHMGVHHDADVDAKSTSRPHSRFFEPLRARQIRCRFKFLGNITLMVLHQLRAARCKNLALFRCNPMVWMCCPMASGEAWA